MNNLKTIWNELAFSYTNNHDLVNELWAEIEKEYSTPKRHYHNLTHLKYIIDRAEKYREKLTDPDTVLFSIFYHDIVYNTKRQDNEQKSADIARDRLTKLGIPPEKISKCQNQIIATKDHKSNGNTDTDYLLDFDLAILGDTPEKYETYSKNIRKEYSLYPEFLYKRGRKKVLEKLLKADRIFKTSDFHKSFEKQARENIKSELLEL